MTQTQPCRFPAEWEVNESVIITWPHAETDWAYMLDEVHGCYRNMIAAISQDCNLLIIIPDNEAADEIAKITNANHKNIRTVVVPTNDTWVRDYGLITTIEANGKPIMNDFMFNGWGMKFAANKDNMVTRELLMSTEIHGEYRNRLEFVLEGGSIESDGNGTLLTTSYCLTSPNRNGGMNESQIEEYLTQAFGLRKMIWLNHGALEGDDTDSHIDTLARFAPRNTILYVSCDDKWDTHYGELKDMEWELRHSTNANGEPFTLLPLPLPAPIYDEEGCRLPATYANFLILPFSVLVPTYAQPENDRKAIEQIAKAFPGRKIIGIDCRALIKQHGSLHCATMQTSDKIIPKFKK